MRPAACVVNTGVSMVSYGGLVQVMHDGSGLEETCFNSFQTSLEQPYTHGVWEYGL